MSRSSDNFRFKRWRELEEWERGFGDGEMGLQGGEARLHDGQRRPDDGERGDRIAIFGRCDQDKHRKHCERLEN